MKEFPGTPGTLTALVLRVSQFVFAVGSIASMATTDSFFNFTAFWYFLLLPFTVDSLCLSSNAYLQFLRGCYGQFERIHLI
ncbi:hypothetical protein CDL15_Pgr016308 [Punica granatum]|uniref:CASP-like protein n=1 Tax=Punica granatum TaxID=22663 RepID=A0A218W6I2_PUNGR|nr:hypothetical protein CDL15_Pgr016308 [Punica granatum]